MYNLNWPVSFLLVFLFPVILRVGILVKFSFIMRMSLLCQMGGLCMHNHVKHTCTVRAASKKVNKGRVR